MSPGLSTFMSAQGSFTEKKIYKCLGNYNIGFKRLHRVSERIL